MLRQRTPLARKTPLRSGSTLKRTGWIRKVSKKKAKDDRAYSLLREAYLVAHPYCQLYMMEHGLCESEVVANDGVAVVNGNRVSVPLATEIHHRNKKRGPRRNDVRWWAASCRILHDYHEAKKTWARAKGYLLPGEADENGRTPGGVQYLTTEEILRQRHEDVKRRPFPSHD